MDRTVPKRSNSMPSGSPPAANLLDDHIFSSNVEDYDINTNSPIGYGASAIVYSAVYKPLNKKVAVKMIDLDFFERNQIDEVRRETQLMSLSKHVNVLRVYGSFVNESKLFIVTPYMSAGSCSDIMKTAHPDGFEENIIATILKQALQGLDYLHKNGHIHRDVKAGNLLVDKDGSVLLADFGVSSSLTENGDRKGIRRTFVGTPCWMAPEVMEHAGYDYKADIWSFGITSLELATGNAPFAKYPPLKVIMVTLSKEPPTLDRESTKHKYTKTFKDMIDICLYKDPTKRPSAEKLLSHQFFRVAKRKDYLVSKILQHLPPLEERPHKRVQQKPITYTKGVTWDFAVDSECRDNDDQENSILQANDGKPEGKRVEFSDTNNNTDTKSDSSAVTNIPQKKSRFLVGDAATESKVPLSLSVPTISSTVSVTPQSPLSRSQPPSAGTNFVSNPLSPGEKDEQNAQRLQPQQSQEIRKGRFSVIESNGSKEKTSSSGSQHESDNNQRPPLSTNENLTENCKKSRFEVQHSPDTSIISSSVFQNISRENTVHSPISLSRESTLSKGDTSFSREGTINRSNGGSLDAQTTEKPMGTKKGRFQVSIDVPPKMDGSISPSGDLLTSETTFSPQSTFLGHSPNISPSSSILRGQGQHMMSTSFSREGTINRSNGGSLDAQTTEKPMGTKKGRFQVSIDVPPKMDGSISPSGNLLTSETTFSPQSTFLGHSPNISPSSSILRGQGQHMMSTSFSREGTINISNGGSLDAQTTEKSMGTKKGRFQVSIDIPPKMDGSISPSGNLLTSETTFSPQSTFLGHSPNISPSSSILRGQGQHMMSTSFSREGTINISNGGSLDAQTTEKSMGTKKGRFQVSIDIPPKMDGSISPSGNLLTPEITFSPQSTFLGHSPNISPSSSILRGQGQHHFTSAVAGRIHSQQIPNANGNTGIRSSSKEISSYLSILDRQFQYIFRDNDELRKENEILRRENENLRKENEKLKKLTTLNSTSINNSMFIPENLTVNSISTTSSPTKSTSSYNINNKSKTLQ